MLTREPNALRRAAYRLAPRKILAYNSRLERHHLRLDLASFLFWRGVPLDRIYLRPAVVALAEARALRTPQGLSRARRAPVRRNSAGASPCSRLTSRIRSRTAAPCASTTCCAKSRASSMSNCSPSPMATPSPKPRPLLEFCARVVLVKKPRYREPRWSTLLPPEVHEFRSPAMRQAIARRAPRLRLRTAAGGVHATGGIRRRRPGGARRHLRPVRPGMRAASTRLAAWWDLFRWRRFETRQTRRYRAWW